MSHLPKPKTPATAMKELKFKASMRVIYASLAIQATIGLSVICFCCFQLTRHNGNDSTKAVYVSILTGTCAYFFPAPWSGLLDHINDKSPPAPARRQKYEAKADNESDSDS
jgi:hypothetical protein